MSLKENITMVKEELSSEEKFFEKAVVTERFIKKYKNIMIGSFVAVVVVVGANIFYDAQKSQSIQAANEALYMLEQDANNTQALQQLQSNSPALYDVWSYAQAIATKDIKALETLKGSKTPLLKDLASYELANDVTALDSYAAEQNAIYKDLALVQSAVFLMQKQEVEKAHQKLSMVSQTSPLHKVALALSHYGVK